MLLKLTSLIVEQHCVVACSIPDMHSQIDAWEPWLLIIILKQQRLNMNNLLLSSLCRNHCHKQALTNGFGN